MTGRPEQNHNRHLDMLHGYKMRLVRQVADLERTGRRSDLAARWNEEAIREKREEIVIIDTVLRNLIRF